MAGHGKRLGDGSLLTEEADEGLGHTVAVKTYNKVFYSLIGLTVLTVWAACQPVGVLAHIFIAILIASIKATIVGFVFMHLKFEKATTWIIAICPFIVFFLLVFGTLGDLMVKEDIRPAGEVIQKVEKMPSKVSH